MTEPSDAALKAAIELEVLGCIGAITTRGLALILDQIAAALRAAPQPAVSPADLKDVLTNVRAGIETSRSVGQPVPHAFHLACQALAHMVKDEETRG